MDKANDGGNAALGMTLELAINGLGLVSTSACLLLVFFLISAPSQITVANRFLAGFLLLTAIDTSSWFSYAILPLPAPLRMFRISLGLLQMPLFLGYFAAVCRADLKPRTSWSLHLAPFLVANLLLAPRFYLGFWGRPPLSLVPSTEYRLIEIGLEVQYYAYAYACFLTLRHFRTVFLERYSDARSATFSWLTQLLAVSLAAHALVAVKSLSVLNERRTLVISLELVVAVVALSVTVWITLQALRHPELFRGVDSRLKRVAELLASDAEDSAPGELERLRAFMARQAPYLDPGLSLESLADRLDMSPRALSVLINHHLGVHFFDFVNGYRVDRAKALLLTPRARSNLLSVMFDVGFNSKSSFNAAFKKHAGVTPSQYRRNHANATQDGIGQEKRPTS
jgi:AraC-like DNA-binding protein